MSYSTKKRNEGNIFYKKCQSLDNKTLIKNEINKAINCYDDALRNASNNEELYKASKNISLSYNIYSNIYKDEDLNKESNLDQYLFTLKMLTKSIIKEIEYSKIYFYSFENFEERYQKILETLEQHIIILNDSEKISSIHSIIQILKTEEKIYYYFLSKLSEFYFNEGYKLFESECYKKAKFYFNESLDIFNQISSEKNKINEINSNLFETLKDRSNSCYFYLRRIIANQYIIKGDNYLQKAIYEEENLDMELIYLAIDSYRDGYCLYSMENGNDDRKPCDIETESICLSKLTEVFFNLFKNKDKAYNLGMQCIELGLCMLPINVEEKSWYKTAKKIVEKIRKEKEEGEEMELNKEFEEYKKNNLSIFEELESNYKKGSLDFVKFVVKKYPFINYDESKFNVEELYNDSEKNLFRKLSINYHPDKYPKNNKEELAKYFIMQEISKYVNIRYNYLK